MVKNIQKTMAGAALTILLLSGCSDPKLEDPVVDETTVVETLKAGNLEISPKVQHKKPEVGTNEVEFTFTALNQGLAPITITKVDSGCACIEESVEPRVIPPGETSRISAVYSTAKLNGYAEKMISISTDQPNVREAFLTVKLDMNPIYVIDTPLSTWLKGKKASPKVVNFEVTRDKPIHIISAVSNRSEFTTEVIEVTKARKYQIKITPDSTGSNMIGVVRLHTDCEIEAHSRPLLYVTVK